MAIGAGVPPWEQDGSGRQAASHLRFFGLSANPLCGRYLLFAKREEIALLRAQGYMQKVARGLGRAASTISRELRRNAATRSGRPEYRATTAQWHAERAAHRQKRAKLALNTGLQAYVEERLAGVVAPSGTSVPGPAVSWKGRSHGPRPAGDKRLQGHLTSSFYQPTTTLLRRPLEFALHASKLYRRLLAERALVGCMGRRANPYDTAKAESFMKTLKIEAVYLTDYETF